MTPHDWFVEHRLGYVARSLEEDEERLFAEHLVGCDECRGATEATAHDLAWLPLGVRPATPRPELTRRLVEGVLRPSPRRSLRSGALALAASLLIAVGSTVWARAEVRRVRADTTTALARLQQALSSVRDTLAIIRSADRVRHASLSVDGVRGGLILFADDRSHRWSVVIYGIHPPRPGEILQFWFVTTSGMVRGVTVEIPPSGPAVLTLGMPRSAGEVTGAAVTLEPEAAHGPQPSGPELLHLHL